MLEKYTIFRKDNTDLNVYRCGYEECVGDPLQFSKTFKKAKGLVPTAFRKHNQ